MSDRLPDSALRFRVWVDGALADEVIVDAAEPNAQLLAERVSLYHQMVAAEAGASGQVWLIEIYDPAKPVNEAFMRFGTDPNGMVEPRPVGGA